MSGALVPILSNLFDVSVAFVPLLIWGIVAKTEFYNDNR